MRNKPGSVLVSQARLKMQPVTIRLPSDVLERMTRVKRNALQHGYVFDSNQVVLDAVLTALELAEKELKTFVG